MRETERTPSTERTLHGLRVSLHETVEMLERVEAERRVLIDLCDDLLTRISDVQRASRRSS